MRRSDTEYQTEAPPAERWFGFAGANAWRGDAVGDLCGEWSDDSMVPHDVASLADVLAHLERMGGSLAAMAAALAAWFECFNGGAR